MNISGRHKDSAGKSPTGFVEGTGSSLPRARRFKSGANLPQAVASDLSLQEQDLALFLNSLEVPYPALDPTHSNGYVVMAMEAQAASWFASKDGKVVLLSYRFDGNLYPISIFFLGGNEGTTFCHSSLILESYGHDEKIAPRLRQATQEFFAKEPDDLLGALEPAWVKAAITGQLDCRIFWNLKPAFEPVVDLFSGRFGEVADIPLFPTVYPYNNPYVENLLQVALPDLADREEVLVLGTGSGLEAACVALRHQVRVDAIDINPIAVANTLATARRVGVDHLVRAWVSDGFNRVPGKYDAILFSAPLAIEEACPQDRNRYDFNGTLLRAVLAALPEHLNPAGRLYLMSRPDLSPFLASNGLRSRVRISFAPNRPVAIHEIRLKKTALSSHRRNRRRSPAVVELRQISIRPSVGLVR